MKYGYTIVFVEDVMKTIDFYEKTFKFSKKFVHDGQQYAELETGTTVLSFASFTFFPTKNGEINKNSDRIMLSFISDNVKEDFEYAIKNGATAILDPAQKPWGQISSCVKDMNGIFIEIVSEINS